LNAHITVLVDGEQHVRAAPFEFAPGAGRDVVLEAPAEVKTEDAVLKFVGWALPDGQSSSERRIILKLGAAAKVVANYQEVQSIPDKDAKPLRITTAATAKPVCVPKITHELVLSWEILDGQRPASVHVEVAYPDHHVETIGLKPIQGTQPFPINYPGGGILQVKTIATDWTGKMAVTESAVALDPCEK
jgi:hypothetical protein